MNTKEAATGRWRDILVALGVPAEMLNSKHHPCPFCGGRDRFRLTQRELCLCNQCGTRDPLTFLMKFKNWSYKQAADEVDKILGSDLPARPVIKRGLIRREDVAKMWTDARSIKREDPVDRYLRSRGISPDDLQLAAPHWARGLRFTARMWHAPGRHYALCMFAAFRDTEGNIATIHRTYLEDVTPRRMFLPCAIPKGGAIQLGEARANMGIAEGIETALSAAMLFKMPVWATTSERLLREWQPPVIGKRITVFGDNDSNFIGQAAAYDLANRLVRQDYSVNVQIPEQVDWDWNDVLQNEIKTERYPDLSPLRASDSVAEPAGQSVSGTN
jgi:putative DNA primase/helicase